MFLEYLIHFEALWEDKLLTKSLPFYLLFVDYQLPPWSSLHSISATGLWWKLCEELVPCSCTCTGSCDHTSAHAQCSQEQRLAQNLKSWQRKCSAICFVFKLCAGSLLRAFVLTSLIPHSYTHTPWRPLWLLPPALTVEKDGSSVVMEPKGQE